MISPTNQQDVAPNRAFQPLANLEVVPPDFAQLVLNNTWAKIFFKLGPKAVGPAAGE